MKIKNKIMSTMCLLLAFTLNPYAVMAAVMPVDLNDFFADPEVTVSPDGQFAEFVESEFVTFVRLSNDPFLGDPEVIVAGAGTALTFGFDFAESMDGDDLFSAILFDASVGPLFGELARFEVTSTQSGMVSFALTPYLGLTLGLEFELLELDFLAGTRGSTATVSNLALETQNGNGPAVPEPATLAMFGIGLAGLAFARRKM